MRLSRAGTRGGTGRCLGRLSDLMHNRVGTGVETRKAGPVPTVIAMGAGLGGSSIDALRIERRAPSQPQRHGHTGDGGGAAAPKVPPTVGDLVLIGA